ncbi:MAG: nucleotidyltransferase family protein [Kofleriaceae bacterium]|nr:nucleotidyltransferase family protein [Kofleriaceae bacterium]MCL4224135.1 nucleotidyltransferase family protein [Myxococcales bacterium]
MTPEARRALHALVRRLLDGSGARGDEPDLDALPAAVVRRHLLAPLAYVAGARQFRADHLASALQAELRRTALDEVVAAFADRGVAPILLKGIAYAGTIYPDPAERPMSDIDLLVPGEAVEHCEAALRRLGYWHVGGLHQRSARHHAITFKRRGASIDLHRHITQAGRTRIDLAAVWRGAVGAHIPGALRPARQHERLLHVAHMGRHELAVPLVNFVDLHRLGPVDPALAAAWGLRRSLAATQAALAQLGQAPGRPRAWAPSTEELLAGGLPPRWLQLVRKLDHLDGPGSAVRLLATTLRSRWP